jgi:hypothetical protein
LVRVVEETLLRNLFDYLSAAGSGNVAHSQAGSLIGPIAHLPKAKLQRLLVITKSDYESQQPPGNISRENGTQHARK